MNTQPYQLFDPLRPEEYDALKADIAKRGIQIPIEVDDAGAILDGHHRARIAAELGIDCPRVIRTFATEAEKRDHVLKINLLRRHLDPIAWARAFARLLEERGVERGAGKRNDLTCATVAQVAAELGVPKRTAYDRLALLSLPELQQTAIASGEIGTKEAKRQANKERRQAERIALAANLDGDAGDLPDGPLDLILADPPWRYEFATTDDRRVENKYPTMSLAEIAGLDVPALCADNTILFLWVTAPKLFEARDVVEAWGFEYKTGAVWDKTGGPPGLGHYFRTDHEHLLVATRGSGLTPDGKDRPSSIIRARRGRHSEKPETVHELIERMYPWARKVELFARQARPGWAAWGNQAVAA